MNHENEKQNGGLGEYDPKREEELEKKLKERIEKYESNLMNDEEVDEFIRLLIERGNLREKERSIDVPCYTDEREMERDLAMKRRLEEEDELPYMSEEDIQEGIEVKESIREKRRKLRKALGETYRESTKEQVRDAVSRRTYTKPTKEQLKDAIRRKDANKPSKLKWERVSISELESLIEKNLISSCKMEEDMLRKGEFTEELDDRNPAYIAKIRYSESAEPHAYLTLRGRIKPHLRFSGETAFGELNHWMCESRHYDDHIKSQHFETWFKAFLEMGITWNDFYESLRDIPADNGIKKKYLKYFNGTISMAVPKKTIEAYINKPEEFFKAERPRYID